MGDLFLLCLRILAGTSGLLLIAAAAFLYEGEEKQVQSVLEDWWVQIDDLAQAAVSRHQAFYAGLAAFTEGTLARLLGPNIFCLKAFRRVFFVQGAIFCFMFAWQLSYLRDMALLGGAPSSSILGSCLAIAPLSGAVLLNFGMLSSVRFALREASRAAYGRVRWLKLLFPVVAMILSLVLVMPLSVGMSRIMTAICNSDLSSESTSSGDSTFAVVTLGVGLAGGGDQIAEAISTSCSWFSAPAVISGMIVLLSLTGLLPTVIYFVSLFVLVAHRLFWPLPNRLLYAVQRFRLLENRRTSWQIGVALLVTAGAPWESAMRALESYF